MKPLNKKDRQKAFWKFTLLFILAVVPVCVAIYLYGKIDKAENNFLRSQYIREGQIQANKLDRDKYYEDIKFSIIGLNTYLKENEPSFVNRKLWGTIETSINKIQTKQDKFYNDVVKSKGTSLDSLTWEMVQLDIDNLMRLKEIYRSTSEKMNDLDDELETTKEDLDECRRKLN